MVLLLQYFPEGRNDFHRCAQQFAHRPYATQQFARRQGDTHNYLINFLSGRGRTQHGTGPNTFRPATTRPTFLGSSSRKPTRCMLPFARSWFAIFTPARPAPISKTRPPVFPISFDAANRS